MTQPKLDAITHHDDAARRCWDAAAKADEIAKTFREMWLYHNAAAKGLQAELYAENRCATVRVEDGQ